ncbi:MAG: Crp/Fnr family transcriptional regulator [Leptospiraceae bacterium]|nr:Crp/Fnr family transcriptional regulator [Leptospiraceae bacterium]MCP5500079.1 Crp/Fnr family transcriptional regulator [Leptospiraceae bacterium]
MNKFSDCNECGVRNKTNFNHLHSNFLNELSCHKQAVFFKKGESVFQRGDDVKGFFCINQGSIRTFIVSSLGKEQSFNICYPGDWVGYRDTIIGDIYNHSAVCLEDVYACFVSKSKVEEFIQRDSDFQHEILKDMAKNWRDSENQAYSLGTKQIHSKLAELLIAFYNSSEISPEIELKITREVMASMIGTTTESVIRALSDFKVRNWISLEKNKIVIQDYNAIFAMSEIYKHELRY